MTTTINLGILLCDQTPEIYGLIRGYSETDRQMELLRLGGVVPVGCFGYVTQIASGTRLVRLDAARQLQRAGVEFSTDIPSE